MSDNVSEITDSTFEAEVLKSEIPTLVDFWATWCAPCKAIAPILDELAEGFSGKIKFVKVNVDDNPSTPGKYGVRSIPTLLLFKKGEVADQIIGAVPKAQIQGLLDKAV
ncbi:MAG: thioredoxin [Thermodesulfobacteriota bacterium]